MNGNEVITLASLALGKEADDAYIEEVYECIATDFSALRWLGDKFAVGFRKPHKSARFLWWERRSPYVATYDVLCKLPLASTLLRRLASTKRCEYVVDNVKQNAKKREERRAMSYVLESNLNEVAFEMLGDDYNSTRSQLDSIRARRVKFICVNDNINRMTPELFGLLREFFEAYYPRRSRFELPEGVINEHLRFEDYKSEIFRRRLAAAAGLAFIIYILVRCPEFLYKIVVSHDTKQVCTIAQMRHFTEKLQQQPHRLSTSDDRQKAE